MALVLTEEQQLLKTSAKSFLKERAPVSALRKLRDERDVLGYNPALWAEMVEMGWSSLNIPEAYGGLNFGHVGLGQVLMEMGRTLTASPMISTVVLGSTAIRLGGNPFQKETILSKIAEGEMVLAFAFEETSHHNPLAIATQAISTDGGFIINGAKQMVIDGHIADKFIVTTRLESNDVGVFVVDANAHGIERQRIHMMDSRNMASVLLSDVVLPAQNMLQQIPGEALLRETLDIGRVALAAEMLGGVEEAFERTLNYLKERRQFGVPIGSFQALQHRAAVMFGEIELCKSIVLKALQCIDAEDPALSGMACMAKAKLGQVSNLVTNEAIQMFGGIGMTDDEEIGFFLKRARVQEQLLGDSSYQLNRLANLKGY